MGSLVQKLQQKLNFSAVADGAGLGVVALGVGMIYTPAGVISAGIALLLLGWRNQ